jgi:hypothetical protein
MAYYLGRDCDVFITTEYTGTTFGGIGVTTDGTGDWEKAKTMADSDATGSTGFAPSMGSAAAVSGGRVSDLIGCDLSMTSSDEDIGPFFGHINTQKIASGRKETTVTVTRKKKDAIWDVMFNGPSYDGNFEGSSNEALRMGARFGLASGADDTSATLTKVGIGLDFPALIVDSNSKICYGYRVHLRLRNGDGTNNGQVYTIPCTVISGHSVSVNPDGTTEETLEFTTSVEPSQMTSTTAATFDRTQVVAGLF